MNHAAADVERFVNRVGLPQVVNRKRLRAREARNPRARPRRQFLGCLLCRGIRRLAILYLYDGYAAIATGSVRRIQNSWPEGIDLQVRSCVFALAQKLKAKAKRKIALLNEIFWGG
jgi:hypothetical protein